MNERVADAIDAALRARGDAARAVKEQAYLKSALRHYGSGAAAIREAARGAGTLAREPLLATVRALWAEPVYERRAAAVRLLDRHVRLLTVDDVPLLERLLREARTWALLDELAVHVVGPLAEREPALGAVLDRWAGDDDFWIRRAALLALLLPLRRGGGDFPRFGRYADAMLDEREFFVRKAIGWVLREVARKRPALVSRWLGPRAARASGVTWREAIKYLPEADRAALAARRGSGPRPRRGGVD